MDNFPKHSWVAKLELNFSKSRTRTFLSKRKHIGPLTIQRPFYPEDDVCHLYLLHPPGGVVGGDKLFIDVKTDINSKALITAPGATKIYRSGDNSCSIINQNFIISEDSSLEWLPMETIIFPGAKSKIFTKFSLTGNAQVAAWEIQCLGRPAINESFDSGSLKFNFELWKDGIPVILDKMKVNQFELNSVVGLREYPIFATFLISNVNESTLALIRDELVSSKEYIVAVTRIEGVAIIRCLGNKVHLIQNLFRKIWHKTRAIVFAREAVAPRIWAT